MLMIFFKLLLKGVSNLLANRFECALTLIGITLVSFLGFFLLLVAHNLHHVITQDKSRIQFEAYWHKNISRQAVENDWKAIQNLEGVVSLTTYPPEKGLKVLARSLGDAVDLSWFAQENNPLPAAAVVTVSLDQKASPSQARAYLQKIEDFPGVSSVHYNPFELNTADSWIRFSRTVLWPLMGLLAGLAGLIVGNTIKLSQLHFQQEIEVLKLVGGTRGYIMLPLLSGGAFLALTGGMFGLLLVKLTQVGLQDLLNVPPLWLDIHFLEWGQMVWTLSIMTGAAVLFSWVNIRQ
mgnify:CR=1 FL=1